MDLVMSDTRARQMQKARRRRTEGKGKVSHHSMWDNHETAFEKVHSERVIFDQIEIAHDGGLLEIGSKPELWSRTRYLSALSTLVFVGYNMYFVVRNDILILRPVLVNNTLVNNFVDVRPLYAGLPEVTTTASPSQEEDADFYLLGSTFVRHFFGDVLWHQQRVVCTIELLMLAFFLGRIIWRLFFSLCQSGYARWHAIDLVFANHIPDLMYFSSIELLHFVTPQVMSQDFFQILFYEEEDRTKKLAWLAITRPLALVIGLDCFLIKYRAASYSIMTNDLTTENVLDAFFLLNQILGVVQLRWAVRQRLFRFVFGGEDGVMTSREIVRMNVWSALVAQKIFERYCCLQALAFMLSWSDDDFQMLVLTEPSENRDLEAEVELTHIDRS